jgi:hypothetical protein
MKKHIKIIILLLITITGCNLNENNFKGGYSYSFEKNDGEFKLLKADSVLIKSIKIDSLEQMIIEENNHKIEPVIKDSFF